jgi:toxin-antitoxin system PIN domain toxin
VYAFEERTPDHRRYRDWLTSVSTSYEPLALTEFVLSGFVRVVTHPRIFTPPAPVERAFDFTNALLGQPSSIVIAPGTRHWEIYQGLCLAANAKGNLTSDAFLAALAIESGSELITADRDFARFHGLRWRHPLSDS